MLKQFSKLAMHGSSAWGEPSTKYWHTYHLTGNIVEVPTSQTITNAEQTANYPEGPLPCEPSQVMIL